MSDLFDMELLRSAFRMAIPLAFAAYGGLLSERSGVVNIALEGMMLVGAFFGMLGSYYTGSAFLGVIIGALSGGLIGFVHAFITQRMKVNHIVSGVALNILALGLTTYLLRSIFQHAGSSPTVKGLPLWHFGIIDRIPILGPLFSGYDPMFYLAIIIGIALSFVLFHTPIGLRIRAAGENPDAAKTAGVNIKLLRYGAVITSGILGGLSGVYLSLGQLSMFSEGMSNGRGYIALAAVIFGKWSPAGAAGAAVFFGFFDALQMRLQGQTLWGINIPSEFMLMLPYILTIVALAGFVSKSIPPAALGRIDEE